MDDDIHNHVREISRETVVRSPPSLRQRCLRFCSGWCTWQLLSTIVMGQMLSLLICGTAVTSQLLQDPAKYNVRAPTAQSFMNYALLCLVYTTLLACRADERGLLAVLKARGWKYFLVAVIDVEANYMVVKAYQNTSLTSVQLLDCFIIPVVLLLSWVLLKVRYRIVHFIGVGICLVGVGTLIWADALNKGSSAQEAPNKLLGDMLCLAGATCYGISNVAQEFVVKNFDRIEFLGMIGLFGSIVNGIQLSVLEREEVASIPWNKWQVVVLLAAFAICLFLMYSMVPIVMKATSATSVNLSLLSADFYSLLVGYFAFHFTFSALYLVAFIVIILGVFVYSAQRTPYHQGALGQAQEHSHEYSEMEDEDAVAAAMAESDLSHEPSRLDDEEAGFTTVEIPR